MPENSGTRSIVTFTRDLVNAENYNYYTNTAARKAGLALATGRVVNFCDPDDILSRNACRKALAMLDVDPQGFDLMDRKLLEALIVRFDGGPAGLDNLAASIGESPDTIEDVIEPYLIQQGYIQRTPRGRLATSSAWQHMGLQPPSQENQLF